MRTTSKLLTAILASVALLATGLVASTPAYAASTTYYVSASGGSDTNDGLSPATAWKTLTKVSAQTFSAGDSVLLKSGDTWSGESLELHGSGTSSNWITLSAYGTGARPAIKPYSSVAAIPAPNPTDEAANGILYAIYLHNVAGWKIKGLEIGFSKSGIVHVNDAAGVRDGLWIEDVYVHDIVKWPFTSFPAAENRLPVFQRMSYSVGIFTFREEGSPAGRLQNVTIKNVTAERTDAPLEVRHADNVNISDVHSVDSYREGLQLTGINYGTGSFSGTLKDSSFVRSGLSGMPWGTAGVQFNAVKNFVADNIEVSHTQAPNDIDGVGIDYEGLNVNVTVKNSYIHDNFDEAVMIYRNPQWSGGVENVNTSLIDNVLENNGVGAITRPHAAFLTHDFNVGNGGTITGNTIVKRDRDQSLNMIAGRTPELNELWPVEGGYTIGGNVVKLKNGNIVNYASTGFSGTQGAGNWTYRQYDGANLTNLAWNAVDRTWVGSSPYLLVGEDWMHPAGGVLAERIWTAPQAETIRITGNPRKTDSALGNGVITSIWKNGAQIWASGVTTTTGVTHDLQVTVEPGDLIAFVLDPHGDTSYDKTTWNPVVEEIRQTTYTPSTDYMSTQGLYNWRYSEASSSGESDLVWDAANKVWAGSVANLYVGPDWQHPGIGRQSVRTWVAPTSGTVAITGTVKKYDSTGGNGIIAGIRKNSTSLWTSGTVTTLTGVAANVTTTVAAGDVLSFAVDANGESSYDKTSWIPTIALTPSFDFAQAMSPYWESTKIYNESVQMISTGGGAAQAPLLFTPTGPIVVKNSALTTTYAEGTDWAYDAATNSIRLLPGSAAASMTSTEFSPTTAPTGCFLVDKVGGGKSLGCEGSYLHDRQLAVSYPHAASGWTGTPAYQGAALPKTAAALASGAPIGVTLFGDSISVGHSSSSSFAGAPNMPNWGTMATVALQSNYRSRVTFRNPSVAGMDSSWGDANATALVAADDPNLVVIAFGMNDGTAGVTASAFKANVQSIMSKVRAVNPDAEFILVATTLANAATVYAGAQSSYKAALDQLAGPGVVVMDMTGLHQKLLSKKRFQDMTGNNVNHPNDFLSRAYAQALTAILIP